MLFFVAFGCDATIRDDRPSYGAIGHIGEVTGGSGSSGGSSSGAPSTGSGGSSMGTGGDPEPLCPEIERLCPVALTYPLGPEGSVELRGNFAPNGWAKGVPMNVGAGSWVAALSAPWGIDIQYKFVLNGNSWIADPANPNKIDDGFGGYNSVLKASRCAAYICAPKPALRFAVLGDYGVDVYGAAYAENEGSVAKLIKSWNPDLIITVGDNNYPIGSALTIDQNIGKYYSEFISPYKGTYGPGGDKNRFFPTLGNHDWGTLGAEPYLAYFTLPGNERYWEWAQGPVRFFGVDSDLNEPDGTSPESVQGQWLKGALEAAEEPIKIVAMHHPPYSSSSHGPSAWMQWPYAEWGATAVVAGHDHTYERLTIDGFTYIVSGLGGASTYSFSKPLAGSVLRFTGLFGAVLAEVAPGGQSVTLKMITTTGLLVDNAEITP